jgi:uncharacterized protein (TIGR03663 family)
MDVHDAVDATEERLAALDRHLEARGTDRVTAFVVAMVGLGLLARLVGLGARTAHFDEGRVGYWALHLAETGEYYYWSAVHGPFLQFADAAVFNLAGANDFTLRVVVALIGALLPLPLLLLREHLDDGEIAAAAAFLAASPVLLYYSRFYRSTLPVAAFCFASFACLVRYYDVRDPRFLHAGVGLLALGFTAKENALVYVVVWIGASGLLIAHEFLRPRAAESGTAWLRDWYVRHVADRDLAASAPELARRAGASLALFVLVVLYFYAPRAGTPGGIAPDGVGFDTALLNPGLVPALVEATVIDVVEGYRFWLTDPAQARSGTVLDQYLVFLWRTLEVLVGYAAPLVGFALAGFVATFRSGRRRDLVLFASYWGFVSVIGYPLGADIFGPWLTVNALVPLAIPAGVGVAVLYGWGREAIERDDGLSAGIVTFLCLLVVAHVAWTGAAAVYTNAQSPDNGLVQFGQPADDLQSTLDEVGAAAEGNSGTDVLLYGPSLYGPGLPTDPDKQLAIEPRCADLGSTLPIQWYLRTGGLTASCAPTPADLDEAAVGSPPPVIIADPGDPGEEGSAAAVIAARFPSYERRTVLISSRPNPAGETRGRLAFFVDTNRSVVG